MELKNAVTEFNYWSEKWQREIDERQKKTNFLKNITHKTLVLLDLDFDWCENNKINQFKVALSIQKYYQYKNF